MKNRIIALLLCVTMLVSLAPAILATEADSGGSEQANVADEYREFYNNLMACTTLEEANALLNTLSDEEFEVFVNSLSEDEYNALNEHMNALIAAAEDEGIVDYVYSAVNFTNVAPLVEWPAVTPTRGAYSLNATGDGEQAGDDNNGLVLAKNAQYDPETGVCTITLEAYTTGTVTTEVENVPTDIVLVLDQSGSMEFGFGSQISVKNANQTLGSTEGYYVKYGGVDLSGNELWYPVRYNNNRWQYYGPGFLGLVSRWVELSSTDFIYISRLAALKNTVSTFANAVAEKAKGEVGTDDDVNHRIAVVGFASGTYFDNTNYDYGNTEVFIGDSEYKYGTGAQSVYGYAFQDMSTAAGQQNITDSINVLDADGGTLTNLGMEMANGILNANPVPDGEKRNRVIIVFTDGAPGWSGYDSNIAGAAISQASTAKENGVTVYTVGIFSGADATSAGNSKGNDTAKANWFMQNLSSNNGTVQSPSYYLSAGDADALNDIFEKISQQIVTGGSSTTLSEHTVIRDIIAPAFTLPEGATADSITLETWEYNGPDNGPDSAWTKNTDAMGATATVFGSQVSVTGFNFAENYVGTVTDNGTVTYRGHKLVIRFTVSPKAGFLGGNNVYTNANAGVYENSTAINPVLRFERPQVNVPIGDVSVTASEKNVYLLNGLTADDLRNGLRVKVGEVMLDLSEFSDSDDPQTINVIEVDEDGEPVIGEDGKLVSFPIEPWQMEYVDIRVVIKDSDGNEISSFENLSHDTTCSITVTVSPKTNGKGASGTPASEKNGTGSGIINVFKPVLTFADSEVWYGGKYTANYKSVAWKHGTDEANTTTMGNAPELTLDYATTPKDAIKKGYIVVPDDIPVNVLVKIDGTAIDEHVSFVHADCSHENCGFDAATCKFILHVNTCSLTVKKAIAAGSHLQDSDQSFIFKVHYQGIPDGEGTILPSADYNVLIVGTGSRTIVGLPVGSYTVSEDTDWSWRYKLDGENHVSTELSAGNSTATVTMTNRLNNELWLSDEAVAQNVFNSNGSPEYSPMPAIIPGKEDLTDEAD